MVVVFCGVAILVMLLCGLDAFQPTELFIRGLPPLRLPFGFCAEVEARGGVCTGYGYGDDGEYRGEQDEIVADRRWPGVDCEGEELQLHDHLVGVSHGSPASSAGIEGDAGSEPFLGRRGIV